MSVDIIVRNSVEKDFEKLISNKSLELLAEKILIELQSEDKELSVLITDDEEMRQLNSDYRAVDKSTDVLSFVYSEGKEIPNQDANILGDVVISYPYLCAQASNLNVSLQDELLRLLTHGVLHLLGFDHELGEDQAQRMFKEEQRILEVVSKKL